MPLPSSIALGRNAASGWPDGDGLRLRLSEKNKERHCAPSQRALPFVAPLSSCARWNCCVRKG